MNPKTIRFRKGQPLMICPQCGNNSAPEFIDLSSASKPPHVIMKCSNCEHLWGFECAKVKPPEGAQRPFTIDDVARISHGMISALSTIIIKIGEEFGRVTGGRFDSTARPRVARLQWMPAGINLKVTVKNEMAPFSVGVEMPPDADEEQAERLWRAADIVKEVNAQYGGDTTPRMDFEEGAAT